MKLKPNFWIDSHEPITSETMMPAISSSVSAAKLRVRLKNNQSPNLRPPPVLAAIESCVTLMVWSARGWIGKDLRRRRAAQAAGCYLTANTDLPDASLTPAHDVWISLTRLSGKAT